jgi:hypothetical protein
VLPRPLRISGGGCARDYTWLACPRLISLPSAVDKPLLLPVEIDVEDQSGATDFLQPPLRDRLSLNYTHLEFGPGSTTLSWLYSPDPTSPCAASTYQVDAYSQNDISANSQRDLRAIFSTRTTQKTLAINSSLVRNPGGMPNYFRVSASCNSTTSAYLHDLFLNG